MNKNRAIEKAIETSISTQSTVVVYEKGFGEYGYVDRDRYNGDEDLIVYKVCCGVSL